MLIVIPRLFPPLETQKGIENMDPKLGFCDYKWQSFDGQLPFLMPPPPSLGLGASNAQALAKLIIVVIRQANRILLYLLML